VGEYATVIEPRAGRGGATFERIIGNSAALESVLQQVERVAPTSSIVPFRSHASRCQDLRIELAALHGIKLKVSTREIAIDPIPALFV
jgi:hypothetical protein